MQLSWRFTTVMVTGQLADTPNFASSRELLNSHATTYERDLWQDYVGRYFQNK